MASLIPDLKKFIVGIEVKDSASVSQSTWRKIGGMINFIGHRSHQEKSFYLNGNYGNTSYPWYQVDGMAFFEFDAEIFNVWVFNHVAGASGITELDVKIKPKGSGAFTSIFSTTPKLAPSSGNDVWAEVGDVLTGVTAPVLLSNPLNVNRGDAIRLDLISAMPGAQDCGVVVHFRPR